MVSCESSIAKSPDKRAARQTAARQAKVAKEAQRLSEKLGRTLDPNSSTFQRDFDQARRDEENMAEPPVKVTDRRRIPRMESPAGRSGRNLEFLEAELRVGELERELNTAIKAGDTQSMLRLTAELAVARDALLKTGHARAEQMEWNTKDLTRRVEAND